MQNLASIFLILSALFVGFMVPVKRSYLKIIDKIIGFTISFILILIGISLTKIPDLLAQLAHIGTLVFTLVSILLFFNLFFLVFLDYKNRSKNKNKVIHNKKMLYFSCFFQIIYVLIGFIIGKAIPYLNNSIDTGIQVCMLIFIFLIGISLNGSGITLKAVLINRRGLSMAILFILSCCVAGITFSFFYPNVTMSQGIALTSGYGWYSLSPLIITNAYGAVWGMVAFFNDLFRELIALAFIPLFMQFSVAAGVAYGGATSMDFTLPTIERAGGKQIVPLAISFSFIVNIVSPIFMIIFSHLNF